MSPDDETARAWKLVARETQHAAFAIVALDLRRRVEALEARAQTSAVGEHIAGYDHAPGRGAEEPGTSSPPPAPSQAREIAAVVNGRVFVGRAEILVADNPVAYDRADAINRAHAAALDAALAEVRADLTEAYGATRAVLEEEIEAASARDRAIDRATAAETRVAALDAALAEARADLIDMEKSRDVFVTTCEAHCAHIEELESELANLRGAVTSRAERAERVVEAADRCRRGGEYGVPRPILDALDALDAPAKGGGAT